MGIVVLVATLHVAVLSMVFGPRHVGYMVSAALSASWIWGAVFLLRERKGLAGLVAAVAVALAVQQVAYRVWKAELPGFWWPLAQFAALQFLVGFLASRALRGGRLREATGVTPGEPAENTMEADIKEQRWISS